MVIIDLPAKIHCDEEKCGANIPAQLCLLGTGGMGFRPNQEGWQLLLSQGNPGTPFLVRCPKHARTLVQPPKPALTVPINGR